MYFIKHLSNDIFGQIHIKILKFLKYSVERYMQTIHERRNHMDGTNSVSSVQGPSQSYSKQAAMEKVQDRMTAGFISYQSWGVGWDQQRVTVKERSGEYEAGAHTQ